VRRHICVADADSFTNFDSPVWDTDQPGDVISRTEITEDTGRVRSVTSYRIHNVGDTVNEGIRCIKCLSAVWVWRNFVGVLLRGKAKTDPCNRP
jgi:hypothetical protein